MSKDKTGRQQHVSTDSHFYERVYPYKTFLFFALTASTILFLSLVFMFVIWLTHNSPIEHFNMPKPFILSTIVLLFTSYVITLARNAFKNDNSKQLILSFTASLGLTMLFTCLQILGWKDLYDQGFFVNGEIGISLIYIITGLHFLHVLCGLLWQFYLSLRAYDVWNDPVKSLLYFSNKFEGARIDLFGTFWHFVDGIWLCLFLTFLFAF